MATFKVDDQVTIKHSTMAGVVKGAALDQVTLSIQYLVEYNDKFGDPQSRYFDGADLEAV